MKKAQIIEKVRGFPKNPGVYLMKDAQGRVLYVGKSVCIRDRVMGYFRGQEDGRDNIVAMLDKAEDVDFIEMPSEVDALLAEFRLIKDLRPHYNIDLKDDKSYPYIEIRLRQGYPQVIVSRNAQSGSAVYGPFMDARALRSAFTLLQKIFKFRVCALEIREEGDRRPFVRPCLYYYTGKCLGPCAGKVTRAEYRDAIRRFRQFLEGKRSSLLRELTHKMEDASARLDFESAATYRDQIKGLENLSKRGLVGEHEFVGALAFDPLEGVNALAEVLGMSEPPRIMDGVDIATIQGSDSVGSVVTFVDGRPFKDGYRHYKIKQVKGQDDYAMIGEVVHRRYKRLSAEEAMMPQLLMIDGGPGQLSAALEALEKAGARPARVVSLAKREELIFMEGRREPIELPRNSPALQVLQALRDEAHRFARNYHHVLRDRGFFGEKARSIAVSARRAKRVERLGLDPGESDDK